MLLTKSTLIVYTNTDSTLRLRILYCIAALYCTSNRVLYPLFSTKDATGLGLSRTVDINGANAHVTSTREATLYGADVSRDKLPLAIDVLDQIGTKQIFKVRTREGVWWDGAIQAVGSEIGSFWL